VPKSDCLLNVTIFEVISRPTVSRPVCLGVRLSSGTNSLLLSLIIFRQLRICLCGAPSLTRSLVCSFQSLLGTSSAAFLRSESHETRMYKFMLSADHLVAKQRNSIGSVAAVQTRTTGKCGCAEVCALHFRSSFVETEGAEGHFPVFAGPTAAVRSARQPQPPSLEWTSHGPVH
jgi:hypothetical protein